MGLLAPIDTSPGSPPLHSSHRRGRFPSAQSQTAVEASVPGGAGDTNTCPTADKIHRTEGLPGIGNR